jgi:biotin carboxyl carrier protein
VAEDDDRGRPAWREVIVVGDRQYRVCDGPRQRLVYAAGPPEARWVFLDGRVYVIDTVRLKADPTYAAVESGFSRIGTGAASGGLHDGEMGLASPMPATVASINVVSGQQVEQGDVLVMLEAMKMELPIRAPRTGRVKAVACRRGELVQPGVPLVEIE